MRTKFLISQLGYLGGYWISVNIKYFYITDLIQRKECSIERNVPSSTVPPRKWLEIITLNAHGSVVQKVLRQDHELPNHGSYNVTAGVCWTCLFWTYIFYIYFREFGPTGQRISFARHRSLRYQNSTNNNKQKQFF